MTVLPFMHKRFSQSVKMIMAVVLLGAMSVMTLVSTAWISPSVHAQTDSAKTAQQLSKVLIINSNGSLPKYRDAQMACVETLGKQVKLDIINLGEKRWTLSKIKSHLYDHYPPAVYAIGTKAYLLANRILPERHIIFSSTVNWQRLPRTDKTYGVANEHPVEMQLSLFRYVFPDIKRIGMLYSDAYTSQMAIDAQRVAKDMGITVIAKAVTKKTVMTGMDDVLNNVDAFWMLSDPILMANEKQVQALLAKAQGKRIGVLSNHSGLARMGAVMSVSTDSATSGRQAASQILTVLNDPSVFNAKKNGTPAAQKVVSPAGSHIIVNVQKAKAFGLNVNEDALGSINEVIE